MAQVIAQVNRPTLVMAHNKTLAAQLYQEFRRFFPDNAVEYFVSYYDYYQPGGVRPGDRHLHREGSDDQRRDRPHAAVGDAVALRAPRRHHRRQRVVHLRPRLAGGLLRHAAAARARADESAATRSCGKLVEIQYERNDTEFGRGTFRVRGDIDRSVSVATKSSALRIELFGDEVDELAAFDPLTGQDPPAARPARHLPEVALRHARATGRRRPSESIKAELEVRYRSELEKDGKLLEAQRLHQRTMFDLEMIRRSATATASRTTRGTSRAARPASRRRRCSTTCRRTR